MDISINSEDSQHFPAREEAVPDQAFDRSPETQYPKQEEKQQSSQLQPIDQTSSFCHSQMQIDVVDQEEEANDHSCYSEIEEQSDEDSHGNMPRISLSDQQHLTTHQNQQHNPIPTAYTHTLSTSHSQQQQNQQEQQQQQMLVNLQRTNAQTMIMNESPTIIANVYEVESLPEKMKTNQNLSQNLLDFQVVDDVEDLEDHREYHHPITANISATHQTTTTTLQTNQYLAKANNNQEEDISELGEGGGGDDSQEIEEEHEIESFDLLKLDIVIPKQEPESLLSDDFFNDDEKEVSELERYFKEQREQNQQHQLHQEQQQQQEQQKHKQQQPPKIQTPLIQDNNEAQQFDIFNYIFEDSETTNQSNLQKPGGAANSSSKRHIKDPNMHVIIEEDSEITIEESQQQHPKISSTSSQKDSNLKPNDKVDIDNYRRSVIVSEPEVINEGYLTKYKLYKIRTKQYGSASFDTEVLRRFSDFEWLYTELVSAYGGYLIPLLPEKSFLTKFNVETDSFSKNRQRCLEFFLQKLFEHPHLHRAPQLRLFISSQNSEFSIVKGEAESLKTIEQKYNNVVGSVKNYLNFTIAPIFGQQILGGEKPLPKQLEKQQKQSKESGIEKDLREYEQKLYAQSQSMQTFITVSMNSIALIEEEITSSSRLNDSMPGLRQKIIDQDILNLKEGLHFQWQKQFHPLIEEWQRNSYAALEALNRRNEIQASVTKDSARIQELELLNRKNNNQRDIEMDVLQNNLQKNTQRLDSTTRVLVSEMRQFQSEQNTSFNEIITKFLETQHEFHFKKNEISQGRVPNLL